MMSGKPNRDLNKDDMVDCWSCSTIKRPEIVNVSQVGCVLGFYGRCPTCGKCSSKAPTEAIAVVRWNYENDAKRTDARDLAQQQTFNQCRKCECKEVLMHFANVDPAMCYGTCSHCKIQATGGFTEASAIENWNRENPVAEQESGDADEVVFITTTRHLGKHEWVQLEVDCKKVGLLPILLPVGCDVSSVHKE